MSKDMAFATATIVLDRTCCQRIVALRRSQALHQIFQTDPVLSPACQELVQLAVAE